MLEFNLLRLRQTERPRDVRERLLREDDSPSQNYRWNKGRGEFSATRWLDEKLFGTQIKESPQHDRPRERLSAVGAENLRLAVNELASNSVRHGGGAGTLTTWRQDGVLVFQVSDGGRIGERLVGRVRPEPDQASGRGLWLVNHLCDLVQIRSDAHGSSVRVQMRLDDDAAAPDA